MSLWIIASIMSIVLVSGYVLYGRFIASKFSFNQNDTMPSHQKNDGIDFVPTKKFYLLGQHFSAIAAAGPIAGPILAAQQFGWLPCLLWIGFGVIFIGSVHDFTSLVASVKHEGHSIAEMVRQHIGRRAWVLIMAFIWLSLIYVIVAFTDITAGTFVGKIEELQGVQVNFERGGAVAMASVLYLFISIVMGVVQRKWAPPLWLMTIIFVPATLSAVFLGTKLSTLLVFTQNQWVLGILGYCFVASLLPVWLLLQPRGYLGGFILYISLLVGCVGIFFGGYEIYQPAFKTWQAGGLSGSLFPFLFVTIACGACSGFHGLVCSGTTSKQIDKGGDCKPIGYGAMLMEGFVAVIALATLMILRDSEIKGSPGAIYGAGIGRFLTLLIGEQNLIFAITFGAMAFSTFIFDTLDVATRLGRYILQELTGLTGWLSAIVATAFTVVLPAFFILRAGVGGWSRFWILFGTSNQLLAALTLMSVSLWLYRQGKQVWYTVIPMLFVFSITFTSLSIQMKGLWTPGLDKMNAGVSLILFVLAALLILEAAWQARKVRIPV